MTLSNQKITTPPTPQLQKPECRASAGLENQWRDTAPTDLVESGVLAHQGRAPNLVESMAFGAPNLVETMVFGHQTWKEL